MPKLPKVYLSNEDFGRATRATETSERAILPLTSSRFFQTGIFSASRLPALGWASLVSQILIVVTGGIVRLTGSGLGCPTWPKCTSESLITVPEMGLHGVIEFANRLLTFVLAVVALWTFVVVLALGKRLWSGLLIPAALLLLGIPAQAILGGFTVLYKLNPYLVGGHFILSAVLICIASLLVFRITPPKMQPQAQTKFGHNKLLSLAITATSFIAVVVGVLVTGAGPHSGDAQSARNGLDLEVWQHLHSYPGYLALALASWQSIRLYTNTNANRFSELAIKANHALVITLILQAVIGVAQSRLGLPPILVALHMLGASVICSLVIFQYLLLHPTKVDARNG